MKKNEYIQQYLESHTLHSEGFDIRNGEFPISATVGEGFEFTLHGKNYITHRSSMDDEGKRILEFRISSFIGLCHGAVHYYCKAHSRISNVEVVNPNCTVGGYLGGIKIPSEYTSLSFDLGIPATKEMIEEDFSHYKWYEIGDVATALRSKEPFYDIIKELENVFDMNEWSFEIKEV